ncbi:Strictosidine synthase 1 [Hordeum vulgare]|nr:Strictosidine synthase 1 [Hordeum vulgare]
MWASDPSSNFVRVVNQEAALAGHTPSHASRLALWMSCAGPQCLQSLYYFYGRSAPLADNIGTKYTMLDPAFDKGHRARYIENGVERRVLDWDDNEAHRLWYDDGSKYRLRLRPQWTIEDIEDLYDDGSDNEAYNDNIRELKGGFREYAPLMKIILNNSIFEASDALSTIHGTRDSEKKLRESMKKIVKKCRKFVGLLGCATSSVQEDEEEEHFDDEVEEEHFKDEAGDDAEEEDDKEQEEGIEVEQSDE